MIEKFNKTNIIKSEVIKVCVFRVEKFRNPGAFLCAIIDSPEIQGSLLLQSGPSLDVACQRPPGGVIAGLKVSPAIRVAITNNAPLTSSK